MWHHSGELYKVPLVLVWVVWQIMMEFLIKLMGMLMPLNWIGSNNWLSKAADIKVREVKVLNLCVGSKTQWNFWTFHLFY